MASQARVFPKLASADWREHSPAQVLSDKIWAGEEPSTNFTDIQLIDSATVFIKNSFSISKILLCEIGAGYPCSEKPAPRKTFRNSQILMMRNTLCGVALKFL